MRNLPSLSSVRAFEAVVRHGSFTRAAEELSISQPSVSYQIRRLETHLGVTLFVRRNRRVELTEDARRMARAVVRAFDLLEDGLGPGKNGSWLSVTTTNSFASLWLVPRLGEFRRANPHIELRVVGQNQLHDLEAGEFDVAIRHGDGDWPSLASEKLFDVGFTPMCSPGLLTDVGQGRIAASDIVGLPLIATEENWWSIWLAEEGLRPIPDHARGVLRLKYQTDVIAAARTGQGLAILVPQFAARDLDEGSLVMPFDRVSRDGRAYWLVYERDRRADPRIVLFRRWLLGQVGLEGSPPARRSSVGGGCPTAV